MKAYIEENYIKFFELLVWSLLVYSILFISYFGVDEFELAIYNFVEFFIGLLWEK